MQAKDTNQAGVEKLTKGFNKTNERHLLNLRSAGPLETHANWHASGAKYRHRIEITFFGETDLSYAGTSSKCYTKIPTGRGIQTVDI